MKDNSDVSRLFPLCLVLYEAAFYMSNDTYLPALPIIAQDLSTTAHLAQNTLTLWFLGSCMVQLFVGPLSDRFGRRAVLIPGGIIFIIATLACMLAPTIDVMLAARFIQGAMIPTMVIPGYACVHETFDHKRAIQTLAWMGSIIVLVPTLGPLLGTGILYFTGWRSIFALIAIFAIVSLIALLWVMPESLAPEERHPLHLRRIFGQYKRVVLNRNFSFNCLALGLLFAGLIFWIVSGPFLVTKVFHYSTVWFGISQAVIFTSYIVCTRSLKVLMNHFDEKNIVRFGLTLSMSGGLAAMLFAVLFPHWLEGLVIGLALYAAGSGFCFPILNRLATESSDEAMGIRTTVISCYMSVFGTLASLIVSFFYRGKLLPLAILLTGFGALALLFKLLSHEKIVSAPDHTN